MPDGPSPHDRRATDRAVAALIGRRLGRFKLIRPLGVGSMAHVLEAEDTALKRRVALKVLPHDPAADPRRRAAQSQFLREAQAAARVAHPAIVQVHEVGLADGFLYIAMELLDAGSLQTRVDAQGPLDWPWVLVYGRRAARALAAAHDAGVLHRDVKPANLLFADDRRIKLADFGLARRRDDDFELPWKVVGTPRYMAPENAAGRYSAASDQFSLAATLWFALTGAPPFDIEQLEHVAEVQRQRPLPDLAFAMPGVPRELWLALERAMAREPDDRFADVGAFAEALRAIDTRPVRPPRSRHGRRRARRDKPAAPRRLYAGALAVLVATMGLVAWFARPDGSPPPPGPSVAVEPVTPPEVEPEPPTDAPPAPVADAADVVEPPVVVPPDTQPIMEPPPLDEPVVAVADEPAPIDATDREALTHAAERARPVRVRGRVAGVDYRLNASPKRAEVVFVDAELKLVIESRFFGAMTMKFGGRRGSGIVGREVVVTGTVRRADGAWRLTVRSTRDIESLGEPDPALVRAYAQRAEADPDAQADEPPAAPPDDPPILSTDTQALRALAAEAGDEAHTVVGRVVGRPALRADGTLVIRLNSQVGLIVVCDPPMRAAIEKRYGPRAASLAGRTVSARGYVRAPDGRAHRMELRSPEDLALARP